MLQNSLPEWVSNLLDKIIDTLDSKGDSEPSVKLLAANRGWMELQSGEGCNEYTAVYSIRLTNQVDSSVKDCQLRINLGTGMCHLQGEYGRLGGVFPITTGDATDVPPQGVTDRHWYQHCSPTSVVAYVGRQAVAEGTTFVDLRHELIKAGFDPGDFECRRPVIARY
jgi:hypothetical protein